MIFLICAALHNIFFLFFYSINLMCIILINKFSKHNRVNVSSYKIKYFNMHMSLDFSGFIFNYSLFFTYLLTHILLDLFDYIYAQTFWFLHRIVLNMKTSWKTLCIQFFRKKIFNSRWSAGQISSEYIYNVETKWIL